MLKKQIIAAMEGKHHDRKRPYSRKRKEPDEQMVGKCECGGTVRGIKQFGRLFTWCEKCTPVVAFKQ